MALNIDLSQAPCYTKRKNYEVQNEKAFKLAPLPYRT